MSEPIYKFFTGRFLPEWYQLSKEEQDSILAKLHEALAKLGAKTTILCNTYGPRTNGCGLESRSSRISKLSRSTWRPFRN